jgi:RNA recognition motif-containing protein
MANEEAKLFVAGLPDSISEDVLRQLFEATGGKVVSVSLPKDRMTGRPRGFGFVTLGTPQEAQAARDALDGSMQAGKSISVRPFQAEPPRRDGPPGLGGPRMGGPGGPGGPGRPMGPGGPAQAPDRTLYVGNLPYDATQQEVQTLVNDAAPDGVVRVHLPMDADGRKRGFGFVTMASAEAAKAAEAALRQADLRGRRLVVNLAHPKGERPPRPEGGGGFPAPFAPAFSGGSGSTASSPGGGPPRHKPHEEKRKRSFEDGGGPKKKKVERDVPRGGGGRFNYGGGDDDD